MDIIIPIVTLILGLYVGFQYACFIGYAQKPKKADIPDAYKFLEEVAEAAGSTIEYGTFAKQIKGESEKVVQGLVMRVVSPGIYDYASEIEFSESQRPVLEDINGGFVINKEFYKATFAMRIITFIMKDAFNQQAKALPKYLDAWSDLLKTELYLATISRLEAKGFSRLRVRGLIQFGFNAAWSASGIPKQVIANDKKEGAPENS